MSKPLTKGLATILDTLKEQYLDLLEHCKDMYDFIKITGHLKDFEKWRKEEKKQ